MKELDVISFDKTPIHCYLWDDVENPKGVIQLSHGMCEHGARYDEMARMFNSNGYIVFADDHRAHGKTETDENRGKHDGEIEKDTVKDLVFFYNMLKDKYHLPQGLLGHSYGSFLGQPHNPPLVRAPVNSFEFQPCGRTPQVEYLLC